jgi:hypothetical protein
MHMPVTQVLFLFQFSLRWHLEVKLHVHTFVLTYAFLSLEIEITFAIPLDSSSGLCAATKTTTRPGIWYHLELCNMKVILIPTSCNGTYTVNT